jgi:chromosome segregation ATPase
MSSEIDSALAAYLAPFVAGRRVLYVGDAEQAALHTLASHAEAVRILDMGEGGRTKPLPNVRVTPFRGGALAFPEGTFDVAIVASVERLGDEKIERIEDLARIVGEAGLVVIAHGAFNDAGHYEAAFESLSERFEVVHVVGRAEVGAHVFAALDAEGGVVVDGSLLADAPPAYGYVFFCASVDMDLDGYAVIQTDPVRLVEPAQETDAPVSSEALEALSEHCESLEAELDAARRKVSALSKTSETERAERDEARNALRKAEKDLAALRAAEAKVKDYGAASSEELRALERRLEERAERVRELEAEVERRGALVRELIETGGEHGKSAENDGALDALTLRAQEAEAARLVASLQVDELRAQLAERTSEGDVARREREAHLEGRERGLRARVAELEELVGPTSARLALAEADLEASAANTRKILAEQEHLREALELELMRARGRSPSDAESAIERLRASERSLSAQVGQLGGQLLVAREHEAELRQQRDLARAEAIAFVAQVAALETETKELREHFVAKIAAALAGTARRSMPELGDGPTALEAQIEHLENALDALRGERDGMRFRLSLVESADAPRSVAAHHAFESETSNVLADEVRTLRAALDAETTRAKDKEDAITTRDGLVTRLQLDLARSEQTVEDLRDRAQTLGSENTRLRNAVVDAASSLDERDALERKIEDLERALAEAEGGAISAERKLEEDRLERRQRELDATARATRFEQERDEASQRVRDIERERDEARRALEDTRRILAEARALSATSQSGGARSASFADDRGREQDADDRETMLRTLTSQLEERNDRIRALERRLSGVVPSGEDDELLRRELLELKERTVRYAEELRVEREARRVSEKELEALQAAAPTGERIELEAKLRARASEIESLRADSESAMRDVELLRSVFAEARQSLESIAGTVPAEGELASRIGTLLTLLGRF